MSMSVGVYSSNLSNNMTPGNNNTKSPSILNAINEEEED
jgi:hypothetical protein